MLKDREKVDLMQKHAAFHQINLVSWWKPRLSPLPFWKRALHRRLSESGTNPFLDSNSERTENLSCMQRAFCSNGSTARVSVGSYTWEGYRQVLLRLNWPMNGFRKDLCPFRREEGRQAF